MEREEKHSVFKPGNKADLEEIRRRNAERRLIKNQAAPGPWYVKANVYRGYGTKYEVKRQNVLQPNHVPAPDETVVQEGLDRKNKEFIAYARNDEPERDIDTLLAWVSELLPLKEENQRLAAHVTVLRKRLQEFQEQTQRLENEKQACLLEFRNYIDATESLYQKDAILRQGLAFYADRQNWDWQLLHNPILADNGKRALNALHEAEIHQMPDAQSQQATGITGTSSQGNNPVFQDRRERSTSLTFNKAIATSPISPHPKTHSD